MRRLALIALVLLAVPASAGAAAKESSITLDPPDGVPGSTIAVHGRFFCARPACDPVRIEIYGVPVAESVRVKPNGTFVKRVKVPGGPSGGQVGVLARQYLPDGTEAIAFAPFEVAVHDPNELAEAGSEEEAEAESEHEREEQEREQEREREQAEQTEQAAEAPPVTAKPDEMVIQVDAGAPSASGQGAAATTANGSEGWPASVWIAGLAGAALLGAAAGVVYRHLRRR